MFSSKIKIINEEFEGSAKSCSTSKEIYQTHQHFQTSLYKTSIGARLTNLSVSSFYINTSFDMLYLNSLFYKKLRYLEILHYFQ